MITGVVQWHLLRPFWGKRLPAKLKSFDPVIKIFYDMAYKRYHKEIMKLPVKQRFMAAHLYSILFGHRRRASALITAGVPKLGWSLMNCVPAGGNWRGRGLTEPGRYCHKLICPWCWMRKINTIQKLVHETFPKGYSLFTAEKPEAFAVYDKLIRAGAVSLCRREIAKMRVQKFVRVISCNPGVTPAVRITYFLAAGTVFHEKPLSPNNNLLSDVLKALPAPTYFMQPENFIEGRKYLEELKNFKTYSCNQQ